MKEIISMDNYGVFADTDDIARTTSLSVARIFNKRHDNVLKDIRSLDCSKEFSLLNFKESKYKDERGKRQPCYINKTT